MYSVGGGGQHIEQGAGAQEPHAQVHHSRVGGKQPDDGLGKQQADGGKQDAVGKLDAHTAVVALPYPVGLARAPVLRHQGGHGVANVLLRGVGKVVDAGGGGKGRHSVDAHGVHDGLHRNFAQLHRGLLHGAGPAVAYGLAQQLAVIHQPPSAQLQDRHFVTDVHHAQQTAGGFAEHSGKGTALAAPAQCFHKKQVAANVQHGADHQKIQRALAVAQRTHGGSKKIIEEGEDQPRKHDAQVVHRNGQNGGGHLQQPQQRVCQQHAQGRKGQREHRARNGGGGDLTLHQLGISRAKGGADQNARAQTHSVDEQDGKGHQGVGGAHGSQCVLAHKLAHDDAVGGVVGKLEQVAQHQRNGKFDQQRRNSTAGHVLGHEKRPLSY